MHWTKKLRLHLLMALWINGLQMENLHVTAVDGKGRMVDTDYRSGDGNNQ